MSLFAMLFPGQGSQYVGMLSSFFYRSNNIFYNTFDEASEYIHFDLFKLIQEGPKFKLNESKYTQVAILTASVSIYRFWNYKHGKAPTFMSGHSLGEYSALVCSDSIKFSDALNFVFLRGQLMEEITINRPTLMQAIIGIDKKKAQTACSTIKSKKIVSLSSINSHNQIVISGDKSAVYKASLNCKKLGAKHIFTLNTNIPAHSKLMKPISEKLKKMLNMISVHPPKIPVINNVDVTSENNSENIKNALIRQIYSTVRWKEVIDFMKLKKNFVMLEIGPNKILTKLNKKDKKIISFSTNNLKNFLIAFKKINQGINEHK
ncbi:[acyl-carrier-protein] S-malonyltransferase [Buchnera aphidicola (Sitobion avenae)]|uniref:Malonyl CoA-acyl carrier protein transacylase n=1 Tax=Buchnera aphidicola (Sitobion avenae) TaxID=571428 RepID=A0A4D6Y6V5_9GAMM|nr:ACP S-malonyltransferase [Buchnera aphidicola]QCI25556.1 [acyl-carrier-protein] S-malonyltransferase [Buchnera aphidicola (Sitobion avenae)]